MSSQFCSRCRGHGLSVLRKGHKNICPYLNCPCDTCSAITVKNQSAVQYYHHRYRGELNTNDGLETVSVSSIEETQGLNLSLDNSSRSAYNSNTYQCPNRFNVLLIDVAVGPDTGRFRFNDQSTQTFNNILVTNVEPAEVTSTHSSSFVVDGTSNQQDWKSRSTDLPNTCCFSLSVDQSTQTHDNLTDTESVQPTTSDRATSPIGDIVRNQDALTYINTNRGAIPDTDHFDLDDLLTPASDDVCITIKAEPTDPTMRSHPTFPTPDLLNNEYNLTSRNTDQYFSIGPDRTNSKDQSTQTRNNIIITEIISVEPTTSSSSRSPITDFLQDRYDQVPDHIDQEVLKRFGCIPFSVVLERLPIPEIYY